MSKASQDLTIRLDESGQRFLFFASKGPVQSGEGEQGFAVEIRFDELNHRGAAEAETLIGQSVLGFFDHLTEGRLQLPKHYLDKDEE